MGPHVRPSEPRERRSFALSNQGVLIGKRHRAGKRRKPALQNDKLGNRPWN